MKDAIHKRLRNLAEKEGITLQLLLIRYFQERLLYRLSQSSFNHNFYLKGGALIYAWHGLKVRPTKDLDLLAKATSNSPDQIREIFSQIVCITCKEDAVSFDNQAIEIHEIVKDGNYEGVRLVIPAYLGNIQQRLQVDIGFGDQVVSELDALEYPTLLEMPSPVLMAYSMESVIAEKFHAMITLGEINSRMKDFHDVYLLLSRIKPESALLKEAVQATFLNRSTQFQELPAVFRDDFPFEPARNAQWAAFLRKNKLEGFPDFPEVCTSVSERLFPLYKDIW